MRSITIRRVAAGAALLAIAACGGAPATSSSSAGGGGNQPPTSSATVASAAVSGHGTVLVAGFNRMTLYQFAQDTAGSGTSACTGGCISTWPPLTVPAGTTPTGASGITGQLATIVRSDGKGTQVTYNGRPLHFYSGDTKPGDANGNYPGWSSVPVSSAGAAPTATPAATPSSSNPYGY
ncbi:MAG: COG4315 family predicted lipoprotein [Candidatus Dormibacteria bacterium]